MIRGKRLGLALWGAEPVPRLVAHAQLAESIGLDSIWAIDSQLLCREVTVTLAACLAATTRLTVATGVTQPVTRHPSVAASALATLHEMSGGRALMGVGTGFSSLRTIGMPAVKIAEVESFVDTVRRLLRKETVAFGAVEGTLAWLPAPVAAPIVVAASGPRMTRAAPRFADGVILHHGVSDDLLRRRPRISESAAVVLFGAAADRFGISGPDHGSPSSHAIKQVSKQVIKRTQSFTECTQSFTE